MKTFENIISDYEKVYGASLYKKRDFLYPFKNGDGYEETALLANKATIGNFWSFLNLNTGMLIIINKKADNSLVIEIMYVDNKTFKNINKNKKQEVEKPNLDDI